MVDVKVLRRKPAGLLWGKESWVLKVDGRKVVVTGRQFRTFITQIEKCTITDVSDAVTQGLIFKDAA
ncbi:hypothetical protein HN592_05000 [Candidatus Woesearchaeota archaeon]|jgi:hypothetical protein|nr:hypothetical protein [Candidatus Woesearchaeota archaeon]MBT4367744.1 hypothetical protein [Candidatus Woesearchaeota archaeon]MBT4712232.1 hypothetical protein [Candidatus Woesearchaeota archaeon]MBT6638780.1 hypothetical protein [Candidatus Woesearchaeota archaeon]MBT7134424.1 hypothetical protein [Candidatus Woesearchaeota archaeon]